ncbi:MAG: flagellar biosynthetic protein FliO [Notoacmeibacter sp.]|nr:flagellar biosynthetic protein FliO [Notoacmeibacter sp.]
MNWITEALGEGPARIATWIAIVLSLTVLALIVIRLLRGLVPGTFIAGGGKRHQRLAVVDATAVDSRRRLVLVRRDEREHLLLIGGPTDVVVEGAIEVRQPAAEAEPAAMAAAPVSEPAVMRPVRPAAARPAEPARPVEPVVRPRREAPEPPAPVHAPAAVASAVAQARYAESGTERMPSGEPRRVPPAVMPPQPAPSVQAPSPRPLTAAAPPALPPSVENTEPDFSEALRAVFDEPETPKTAPGPQPAPPIAKEDSEDFPSLEEEMKRLLDQLGEEKSGA